MIIQPSPATIRAAQPDDIPRLLELYLQLSESSQHPEPVTRPVTDHHADALLRMTEDPHVRLFVAEADGVVIATSALYILPNLSHGGRSFALVENVVVDESARERGLGRQLMAHAVRLAWDAGCYKVTLTSNKKRAPAQAFYKTLGFGDTHEGFTLYAAAAGD